MESAPGLPRPLSVTSSLRTDLVLQAYLFTRGHLDLQPNRFEPERVCLDSESENEEVNDRLEGTFWCSRCSLSSGLETSSGSKR